MGTYTACICFKAEFQWNKFLKIHAPTTEQKRTMRIARKKRKKLERRQTREAQQEARHSKVAEAAIATAREEANRQRKLASKYYKLWAKCAKQKNEMAKLWGEKRQRVSPSLDFVCIITLKITEKFIHKSTLIFPTSDTKYNNYNCFKYLRPR